MSTEADTCLCDFQKSMGRDNWICPAHNALKSVRYFPTPTTPITNQLRIATYLDEVQIKVAAMK
jgi:hypothetical protein